MTMTKSRTAVAKICAPDDLPGAPLPAPNSPEADAELALFGKALAHPTRVRILCLLARKEARMCSHIVDELPLAQSTVSEHLRVLRAAGLVRANESGPCVGYCIVPSQLQRFKRLLDSL
jgi:ArsR family transcriptional regulator, arsenate/arsenite/antimonite-responsive transcriptional repressor